MMILNPAKLVIKINHHTQYKLLPLTILKEQERVLQANKTHVNDAC